ncbi:MAG TPA: sulfatase-like hydrolase/transferase, partial [Pirellulales bacterium]|nr:sulfatase-like hydrolase/transferase [Pirellulales bacterium]
VKFIRDHQNEPFFIYLPHSAVHFPHYPSPDFVGKSGGELYNDWAMEVDASTGQVLDALRELKLDERTLVIFTSDNGGPINQGATNTPLRGSKNSTWEGGVRVCTIAWWPGHVPANTSTAAITTMMDVLPTLASLAGASLAPNRKIDGVDQSPVLSGSAPAAPLRDTFHYFRGMKLEAVRRGDWKLHLDKGELYHLGRDIAEADNVAQKHPDVVRDLRALAESMDSDLGVESQGPGVRPLGHVDNPQPLIARDGEIRKGFE